MGDQTAGPSADQAITTLAARQYGVFALTDAVSAGLSRKTVSDRVATGRLWRLHRGVYSVVPPNLLKVEGRWLAAVLACGPGAVLSHAPGAALWKMRGIPSGPIDVTVPTDAGRSKRRGIRLHRSSTLLTSQTTIRRGIPVTNPARTLADLRRTLPTPQYQAALRKAEDLQLDVGDRGLCHEPPASELERRFRALCRRHGLPHPLAQQQVGAYTVDFMWPGSRLIVEVDGFGTHGRRSAFESDRARDAWLIAHGYRVVRFTWRQLTEEPDRVVAILRKLLGRP